MPSGTVTDFNLETMSFDDLEETDDIEAELSITTSPRGMESKPTLPSSEIDFEEISSEAKITSPFARRMLTIALNTRSR
jgi:hypothetical protein